MIVKSIITNIFFSQHQQIVEGGITYSPFPLDKDKCTENGTERADNSQDVFCSFAQKMNKMTVYQPQQYIRCCHYSWSNQHLLP